MYKDYMDEFMKETYPNLVFGKCDVPNCNSKKGITVVVPLDDDQFGEMFLCAEHLREILEEAIVLGMN